MIFTILAKKSLIFYRMIECVQQPYILIYDMSLYDYNYYFDFCQYQTN